MIMFYPEVAKKLDAVHWGPLNFAAFVVPEDPRVWVAKHVSGDVIEARHSEQPTLRVFFKQFSGAYQAIGLELKTECRLLAINR